MQIINQRGTLPQLDNNQRAFIVPRLDELQRRCEATRRPYTLIYKESNGTLWTHNFIPSSIFGQTICILNPIDINSQPSNSPFRQLDGYRSYSIDDGQWLRVAYRLRFSGHTIVFRAFYVIDFSATTNQPAAASSTIDTEFNDLVFGSHYSENGERLIFSDRKFGLNDIPENYFADLLPPDISDELPIDGMVTYGVTYDIFGLGFSFPPP